MYIFSKTYGLIFFSIICLVIALDDVNAKKESLIANDGHESITKAEKARKKYTDIQVLLAENKYELAYTQAGELISKNAGNHQIGLYLSFWQQLFYLQDEQWRRGPLRPIPAGITTRIEAMKAAQDKNVLDLVKVTMLDRDNCEPYLEELLERFPNSVWKDWAEWMLFEAKTVRLGRRERYQYQDKSAQEREYLLMRDLYNGGKKFIEEHQNSYMLPCALEAVASWKGHMRRLKQFVGKTQEEIITVLQDQMQRMQDQMPPDEETIMLCRRILREFPSAEYYCACARTRLRSHLGTDCPDVKGYSPEDDKVIRNFYCPHIGENKGNTRQYLEFRKKVD